MTMQSNPHTLPRFKTGDTVIYDGDCLMQVCGTTRKNPNCQWEAVLLHCRTGITITVPEYCLTPLREACTLIQGGKP
jgi:hypothetical protein